METYDDLNPYKIAKHSILCYRATMTTSAGIWLGDNPLRFSLPLLMMQMTIIFIGTRLSHSILRHLGQPQVVSQIVAGILMGPSCLGHHKGFETMMFPPRSRIELNTVSLLAFMLFIFVIGVKTDLGMIRKSGKKAVAIALIGTILPFTLTLFMGYLLRQYLPQEIEKPKVIFHLAAKWCLTSYTVLSCTLADLNLLTSKLGRLAMSASLIADFFNLVVSSVVTAITLGASTSTPLVGLGSITSFLGFLVFIVFVARPMTLWMIRRTPEGGTLDEAYFMTIIVMALGCGLISEVIGHHATMGPFMLGLALPGGPPLGVTLVERLDRLVSSVFLPTFMAIAGFRTDVATLVDVKEWGFLELFIVLCILGKFVGVMMPALYCKMPLRDALTLGLMMNTKGIFEIDAVNQWQDGQIVDRQMYAIIVLSIVVFGGGTAPLIKILYKPSRRFVTHKRRTIQHSKRNDELRVLTCIHNADNVPSIINLLEISYATKDTPMCIYALHLVQLIGRAAAVLFPYKRIKGSSNAPESDHIVNAFQYFEQQNTGRVSVLPYIGISPFATMHDDICSLALDKKASLVIVPFHKHMAIDGTESVTPPVQALNINVLSYAPCSVAILIDCGLSGTGAMLSMRGNQLSYHVAVYFLGGADDREALAYAVRMAENPTIGVTVVRFRMPEEWRENGKEEKMDDEMVKEFRVRNMDNHRVVYREEVVRDGEGTVGVIRSMSSEYSLLIVGRREGKESPMTEGLEMWSEYPELGLIGDLLASTDFGGRVSTLVVQQQVRVGGGGGGQSESPRKQTLVFGVNKNMGTDMI